MRELEEKVANSNLFQEFFILNSIIFQEFQVSERERDNEQKK